MIFVANESLNQSLRFLRQAQVLGPVLSGFPLFRGLEASELDAVVSAAVVSACPRGAVLLDPAESATTFAVVLRGRAEVQAIHVNGSARALGKLGPGDHYGELGLLTGAPSGTRVLAATDVLLLQISQAAFERLFRQVPAFAEQLGRALGLHIVSSSAGRIRNTVPTVVGIAGPSRRSGTLLGALRHGLTERGAPHAIVHAASTRSVDADTAILSDARAASVQRIAELRATNDIVLLVSEPEQELRPEDPLLSACEELWWIVEPGLAQAAFRSLALLLERKRALHGRIRLVWSLHEGEQPVAGARPDGLLGAEYRLILSADGVPATRRQRLSLRRIVGALEGLRIGLALGGGGARGLSHCGVLKVLEEEGIAIDRIVGTSIGALVGMNYAAGTPPDEVAAEIAREAQAPWWLRRLPKGRYLNFARKARTGAFERSLRAVYGKLDFDHLDFPLHVVVSDLTRAEVVVRERGDCIDGVIESINLPPFARPIVRDGRMLVDGGILNNLPTDVLLAQEVEVALAVDVLGGAAESEHEIGGRGGSGHAARPPGVFETMLRVAEVQHTRLSSYGAGAADLLLHIHTGSVGLADFDLERAPEIVALGEVAARTSIASIRGLLPSRWRGRG
jgi:predicted acylesterase/phospholipase RssA/CRP-like cAMP-binding protein